MNFLDLKDISEQTMGLVNPTSTEKIIKIGAVAGLRAGSRVIDFGAGFGEALALWAERFGISGVGIEIRPKACERARQRLAAGGWSNQVEIVCGDAGQYAFEPHGYDVAACLGASFVFGGWQPCLRRLQDAVKPGGKLMVGEPYWLRSSVPPEYARSEPDVHTELELFQLARAEGLTVEYVVRASHDDWDRYEADNWQGLAQWLAENPDHPERDEVRRHLVDSQDWYARYGREYFGWAIYLLG